MTALQMNRRAKKPYIGMSMEGPLATWYAKTTGKETWLNLSAGAGIGGWFAERRARARSGSRTRFSLGGAG